MPYPILINFHIIGGSKVVRMVKLCTSIDVKPLLYPLRYDTIESLTWTRKLSIQLYLALY